jgi:hypothetical protein
MKSVIHSNQYSIVKRAKVVDFKVIVFLHKRLVALPCSPPSHVAIYSGGQKFKRTPLIYHFSICTENRSNFCKNLVWHIEGLMCRVRVEYTTARSIGLP